jgi:hypothetical protein
VRVEQRPSKVLKLRHKRDVDLLHEIAAEIGVGLVGAG